MNKILITFLLFFHFQKSYCQNQNNNWFFGFRDTIYNENCGVVLWNEKNNKTSLKNIDSPLNFESTMAALSDSSGRLLLYTNGCSIADSNNLIIENGNGLNPGEISDLSCNNYGYSVPNGAMFLPWPGTLNKYVLLHLGSKSIENGNQLFGPFYYSVIQNNKGVFSISEKNIMIVDQDLESFAVVRHGNGKDWWIILPESHTNWYHTFLFDKNGFTEYPVQKIGYELPDFLCKTNGLSRFSPDGKRYLRFNNTCGYFLFDFDRCSGLLSNEIFEPMGFKIDDFSSDFIFSPDSKYIYINKLDHHILSQYYLINKLYRVEIEKIGQKSNPYLEYELPFDFRFNRFFVSNNGTIHTFHPYSNERIFKLDIDKETENLNIQVFKLPVANARTVPYFADFNLTATDCQTNMNNYSNEFNFSIYPNPLRDNATIEFDNNGYPIELTIRDITGKKRFYKSQFLSTENKVFIDFSNFISGLFYIELKTQDKIYILKAVKI